MKRIAYKIIQLNFFGINRKAIKKYKKQIPRQFNMQDTYDKLKEEIDHLETFDSTHIIKYFDAFIEDERIHVVFEYCQVILLN